ncbi:MAG: DUF357 domain-containing protein [Candidatus Diapherotrites archaeon]|nr:DUF357 domain-containing protein [Candidatus Diapherotrites archaeon]
MSKEKYELCLRITSDALDKLQVIKDTELARAYLEFANNYFDDAKHFAEKGEYDNALEAIAYAHGFIDAGVLAGLFRINGYHLEAIK